MLHWIASSKMLGFEMSAKLQFLFLLCWLSSWNLWFISYVLQCWPKQLQNKKWCSGVQTCWCMLNSWGQPSTAVLTFNLPEHLKVPWGWKAPGPPRSNMRWNIGCLRHTSGTSLICYVPFSSSYLLLISSGVKYCYRYFGVLPIAAILQNNYQRLNWTLWELIN